MGAGFNKMELANSSAEPMPIAPCETFRVTIRQALDIKVKLPWEDKVQPAKPDDLTSEIFAELENYGLTRREIRNLFGFTNDPTFYAKIKKMGIKVDRSQNSNAANRKANSESVKPEKIPGKPVELKSYHDTAAYRERKKMEQPTEEELNAELQRLDEALDEMIGKAPVVEPAMSTESADERETATEREENESSEPIVFGEEAFKAEFTQSVQESWNGILKCDMETIVLQAAKELDGKYPAAGLEIGLLVQSKQGQYGDMISAMGPILRQFYPNGIKPGQYDDLTIVVRVLDKIGRITRGNGEGDEDAWSDIAGYGLLGQRKQHKKTA